MPARSASTAGKIGFHTQIGKQRFSWFVTRASNFLDLRAEAGGKPFTRRSDRLRAQ